MKKNLAIILLIVFFLSACASPQKKLAAQQEKDPKYQYEKASYCVNIGLFDEAIKYINKTILLDPNYYLGWYLLGITQSRKGNLNEAEIAYKKCIDINPNFSESYYGLGILYEEQGNLDKAIVEYDKAFSLDQNSGASYQLGAIYFRQNKYDLALGYVEKSLKKYNRSLYALNLQGLILDNLGRFLEAIESYKKALDIAPDETNIRFNLAYSYYHMNEFGKSKEILERLLKEVKDPKATDQINALLKLIRERSAEA